MDFARFMSRPAGRGLRIVAGIVLMFVGIYLVKHVLGYIIVLVGLVPLIAGIGNFCLLAPLFGGPFKASNLAKK